MSDLTEQVREAAPSCPQCHGRRSEIRERVVVCSFCHGEGYVLTAAAVARALTKVIESVPYQWRARLRREFLAKLRESSDA